MPERRVCSFSGDEIEPGTGTMYVRRDGSILWFKNSKARKNMVRNTVQLQELLKMVLGRPVSPLTHIQAANREEQRVGHLRRENDKQYALTRDCLFVTRALQKEVALCSLDTETSSWCVVRSTH